MRHGNSAVAQKLARMVPKCPSCQSGLAEHHFAEVATAICGEEYLAELTTFFECAKNRQWAKLRGFRSFKGDCDAVVANVVACDGGGALVVLRSVFELYAADEVLLLEPLTRDDIGVLKTLIGSDEWQAISD